MSSILQIHQTPARLYMDADPGQYSIRQPKAEVHITTTPGVLEVESTPIKMEVDSSKAFAAYHGGNSLEMNQRIYSGFQQMYLQALAKRVEQGNQAAAIHKPGNTIAEIYGTDWKPIPFPETRGEASMDNVDIRITTAPPDVRVSRAQVDVQAEAHKPEIEYTRGKLEVYMKQYPSVRYIPPDLDLSL